MDSSNKGPRLPIDRKHYEAISHTLHAYQTAVNEAAIVSITDIKGNIVYVNQMFVDISKYTEADLLGRNHRLINSGYHDKAFFRNMWKDISAGKSWRGEIRNRAKDGTYYWVDTVITPIVDKKGRIFQYLSIRNLITAQKENEQHLLNARNQIEKREQQLNDAQGVSKTGSWYLNISPERRLEWSTETYRIFEIVPGTEMTYERFMEAVHPADRDMVNKQWQQALKTGVYHIEHRVATKGGVKWVTESARFEFDETGNLTGVLGTVQDITEKRITEDSLKESGILYKSLFDKSPFAIGIVDKKTLRFLEVNETATVLYGYSRAAFLKLSADDILVPGEHKRSKTPLLVKKVPDGRSIMLHRKKDGGILYVEPSIRPITYKGHPVYLITITDMTAKLKIEKELNAVEQLRQKDIIEAEEKSRSQIGMELHDNVNQLLVASRLYLQRVHTYSEKSKTFLKTALDILTNALEEIRKLSASLVTPISGNNNLKDSLEGLFRSYELLNLNIELELNIDEDTIKQGLKTNIYRIIQEQFSNIMKYAEATKIRIVLIQHPDFLELEIADNGKGFNLQTAKKGIGLTNIIYRAEAYRGKISINTGINKGCKILVRFNTSQVRDEL